MTLSVGTALARSEFRGAWVTAWNRGFLTPAEADATVEAAKAANINALFIQVRKIGDAYYDSTYEPRATNISDGYDPLKYIIDRAHEEGIEVHAWINVLRVRLRTPIADSRHVCNSHPEWITRDVSGRTKSEDGVYLDPGSPGVQYYTTKVALDIVTRYDVDGIHLDYIRYPGTNWGYNDESVARFNKRYGRAGVPVAGDSEWCDWRREQVTNLVRRIYSEANSVKPRVKVTAATIAWGECYPRFEHTAAYRQAFQDWAGWMRDGLLDAVVPMNYHKEQTADSVAKYRGWLDGMRRWQYGRHAYAGQMVGDNLRTAVARLSASRAAGTDGMVCFTFNDLPGRADLVAALRGTVYAYPAEPPSMPWKQRVAWAGRSSVRGAW